MNNRKAFYSTITGFFLISIVVFGLIGFLAFYTSTVQIQSANRDSVTDYTTAQLFKDELLLCHEKTILNANTLDDSMTNPDVCPLPDKILGYEVEQLALLDCNARSWSIGSQPTNAQVIVYNVVIEYPQSTKTCVGKLYIYV